MPEETKTEVDETDIVCPHCGCRNTMELDENLMECHDCGCAYEKKGAQ